MTPSWDMLNAYVDGELDAASAARVAAAVAGDPDLAAQVATLTRLKASAANAMPADMPDMSPPVLPQPRYRRRPLASLVLAAASLLLALGLGAATLVSVWPAKDNTSTALLAAAGLHRAWINGPSGAVGPSPATTPLALTEIPDLSAAGLTLSHVVPAAVPGERRMGQGGGILVGFRGPRGCRVSLWIGQAFPDFTAEPARQQIDGLSAFVWRVEHKGYALMTRDMDAQRFVILASAVARITRERFQVDTLTRMALQQSADPALPCPA
ncbi:MAG: hypothetical protein ACK4FJ_19645 [Ferrovibrio sp.]|uniref:hypothetical protein n=1 Tax=Ferrovibrio sp. TaxID=1917215 RepID=UPI00391A6641